MRVRVVVGFVLFALVVCVAPPALGQWGEDGGMSVSGSLRVNGRVPVEGAGLSVWVGEEGPLAVARVENGTFAVRVPADDPGTGAREGAREGEPLVFRMLGGSTRAGGVAFAPGGTRFVNVSFSLPDVRLESVTAQPARPMEGENVTLVVRVANLGEAEARGVRVVASEGGAALAGAFAESVPAGSSRTFSLAFSTEGWRGARSVLVSASASNGDAVPGNDAAPVAIQVAGRDAPRVEVAPSPAAPVEGERVRLVASAQDADGVAYVVLYWETEGSPRALNLSAAPFEVDVGVFARGTALRYWATAVDATGAASTTPQASVVVGAPPAPAPGTPPSPPPSAGAGVAPTPEAGPEARGTPLPPLVLFAAFGVAATFARRRG